MLYESSRFIGRKKELAQLKPFLSKKLPDPFPFNIVVTDQKDYTHSRFKNQV